MGEGYPTDSLAYNGRDSIVQRCGALLRLRGSCGQGTGVMEVLLARERRIGVSLSDYEQAILAANVELCGYADQSAVVRSVGVAGARENLARIAPKRLAAIDERFGGGE